MIHPEEVELAMLLLLDHFKSLYQLCRLSAAAQQVGPVLTHVPQLVGIVAMPVG